MPVKAAFAFSLTVIVGEFKGQPIEQGEVLSNFNALIMAAVLALCNADSSLEGKLFVTNFGRGLTLVFIRYTGSRA